MIWRLLREEPSLSLRNDKSFKSRGVRTQPLTMMLLLASVAARRCLMSVRMAVNGRYVCQNAVHQQEKDRGGPGKHAAVAQTFLYIPVARSRNTGQECPWRPQTRMQECLRYSTVTLFARLRVLSTWKPRSTAML